MKINEWKVLFFNSSFENTSICILRVFLVMKTEILKRGLKSTSPIARTLKDLSFFVWILGFPRSLKTFWWSWNCSHWLRYRFYCRRNSFCLSRQRFLFLFLRSRDGNFSNFQKIIIFGDGNSIHIFKKKSWFLGKKFPKFQQKNCNFCG